MDVFEGKSKQYRKQLIKLGGETVLRSRPRAAMFVLKFLQTLYGSLSRDPLGDRTIPRAKVRVTAQASHRVITVSSTRALFDCASKSSFLYFE